MRPQAAWKVSTQSPRAPTPSRSPSRSFISPAALLVNVIARISFAFAPTAWMRWATRYVSTRVLPEPAPAITSKGPSVASTASRWAGFKSARYCSGEATAMPSMLATALGRLVAPLPKRFCNEVRLCLGIRHPVVRIAARELVLQLGVAVREVGVRTERVPEGQVLVPVVTAFGDQRQVCRAALAVVADEEQAARLFEVAARAAFVARSNEARDLVLRGVE